MKEFRYTITDSEGIHARPAGEFVKEAKKFASEVKIVKGEKSADAKKIFGLMSLGVKQGEEILIQIYPMKKQRFMSLKRICSKGHFKI